jgi:microcystin-dependent protein
MSGIPGEEGQISMGQPYVGQVIAVGFQFTPSGWLACNGQLLAISQYEVLYTLIGTTYGGDGQQTFGVPDLRGRSPVNAGQGAGLSTYVLGQLSGTESVTLTAAQIGSHSHPLMASANTGNVAKPASTLVLGQGSQSLAPVYAPPPSTTALAGSAIGPGTGGNQPHENRQPFNTVNYIICYAGVFPSRS